MPSDALDASLQSALGLATSWGLQVLGGVALLIAGLVASRVVRRTVSRLLLHGQLDPALAGLIGSFVYYLLVAVTVIAVFGMVGIETASLITILGASSLAIGLALQGSLSNLASGVMLLIFRPFKAGDYIETGDFAGRVVQLGAFSTLLDTLDEVRVVLPNTYVAEHPIQNWTQNGRRRLDLELEVGVDSDLPTARATVVGALAEEPRVLDDPAPVVGVTGFGDTSARLAIRPWCRWEDYWSLQVELPERLRTALAAVHIHPPTPQRDLRVAPQPTHPSGD